MKVIIPNLSSPWYPDRLTSNILLWVCRPPKMVEFRKERPPEEFFIIISPPNTRQVPVTRVPMSMGSMVENSSGVWCGED